MDRDDDDQERLEEEEEENPLALSKQYVAASFSRKEARACKACGLIKTAKQFMNFGCENCPFLELTQGENMERFTSRDFAGTVAVLDPEGSWAAKWTAVARGITGIYAVKVYGDVPDELEELCGALPCKILIDMESDREQMKREAGY